MTLLKSRKLNIYREKRKRVYNEYDSRIPTSK